MKHTYVVGTFVDSMTGMEADYFSDPYDVIEAESKKEACEIYNEKHKCDYFCGRVMAEIQDDMITDLDKYARLVDVEKAISKSKDALYDNPKNHLTECPECGITKPAAKITRVCGYLLDRNIIKDRK